VKEPVLFDARKEDRCPHLVFPFPHPDSSPPRNYFLLCLCGKVCETAFRVSSVRVPVTVDQRSRLLVSRESGIHWSPGPFKGQEEKACSSENSCNAGIAHIQYVSRARPKHPPESRPGPTPMSRPHPADGSCRASWHLGTRGSPGAAPGRGRRASMVALIPSMRPITRLTG
jgi:hypothetical protein